LVIHGIGRQHRFQTLDRFVNGLRAVTPWATVTHVRHPPTEPFDHFVRLRGKRALDVFELYWVPRTVEKTSFAAVARWLYATGFAPFRRLEFNLPLLIYRARTKSQKEDQSLRVWMASWFGGKSGPEISWFKFGFLASGYFLIEVMRVSAVLALTLLLGGSTVMLVATCADLLKELTRAVRTIDISTLRFVDYTTVALSIGNAIAAGALAWSLPAQLRNLVRVCRISPAYVWPSGPDVLWALFWAFAGVINRVKEVPGSARRALLGLVQRARPRPVPAPAPAALPPVGRMAPAASLADVPVQASTVDSGSPVSADEVLTVVSKALKAFSYAATALKAVWSTTDKVFGSEIRQWALDRIETRRWRAEIAGRIVFLVMSSTVLGFNLWLAARLLQPAPLGIGDYHLSSVVYSIGSQLGRDGLWQIARILLLLLAGVLLKRVFIDYFADIALYTTSDDNSAFAKTRAEILRDAVQGLQWLLRNYESVAIAGHSLGSVIAYDAINSLRNEAEINDARAEFGQLSAQPPSEATYNNAKTPIDSSGLRRLHTVVTFGSPLNKVLYFFRTTVQKSETIRSHILATLHGFRRPQDVLRDPRIDDGLAIGSHYTSLANRDGSLDWVYWVNIYSPLDPVSARLVFYDNVREYRRWYTLPGFCHTSYWHDPRFYEEVLAALDRKSNRAR